MGGVLRPAGLASPRMATVSQWLTPTAAARCAGRAKGGRQRLAWAGWLAGWLPARHHPRKGAHAHPNAPTICNISAHACQRVARNWMRRCGAYESMTSTMLTLAGRSAMIALCLPRPRHGFLLSLRTCCCTAAAWGGLHGPCCDLGEPTARRQSADSATALALHRPAAVRTGLLAGPHRRGLQRHRARGAQLLTPPAARAIHFTRFTVHGARKGLMGGFSMKAWNLRRGRRGLRMFAGEELYCCVLVAHPPPASSCCSSAVLLTPH